MGGPYFNLLWKFLIIFLIVHFQQHNSEFCQKSVPGGIVYFDHEAPVQIRITEWPLGTALHS